MKSYVEVAVAVPGRLPHRGTGGVPGAYSYHLEADEPVGVGWLVEVPFGSRSLPGIVCGKPAREPEFQTRAIARVLGDGPVASQIGVSLAHFVARTYLAPLFDCMQLVLPPGFATRLPAALRDGFWAPPKFKAASLPNAPREPPELLAPRLTSEQESACDSILEPFRNGRSQAFLLDGVTGSGKTLVYTQAVAEIVATGGQAIVLVSEIGLTPELLGRMQEQFPGRTAVLHSRLTGAEHYRNWLAIKEGRAQVVIGSRSALFAPAERLGLIVLDEEHEPSFKQESTPRYHAREVALELGRLARVPVVLSSATPDVSTTYSARSGKLRQLRLPSRYQQISRASEKRKEADRLPAVFIADLRDELRVGNTGIFSRVLQEELELTLQRGEQAILFINRRGAATCVTCRQCGYVVSCPSCQVPMVYHYAGELLICHRCNRRRQPIKLCPACGSSAIRHFGIGTQRVELELALRFPSARVIRWDRDTGQGKGEYQEPWQRFHDREADVLVGTQMVAKALDFPMVTLVGVVLADIGLFLPDFRAPERSFQLMTQVAGRAGRAERPGRVVIQTYSPEHYGVRFAAAHDYDGFYEHEIAFRQPQGYPPFGRLVRFVYSNANEQRCWRETGRLRRVLQDRIDAIADAELRLIGPAPCYIQRVRGRYRWQLIARVEALNGLLDGLTLPPGWIADVDPVNLL